MKSSNTSFQITRTATTLEFVLRSGGVPNDEMVRRINAAGRQISGDAKATIACFAHEPEEKGVRVTAPLLSEWFSESPTTDEIYAEAATRGLLDLHPSVGLHLAELYTEQPNDEWVRIGHKPIPVPAHGGCPDVLVVGHNGIGRCLDGFSAHPGSTWGLGVRFAFEVPTSLASGAQVS